MDYSRILQLLCIAGLTLGKQSAQAADEEAFLSQIRPASELVMRQGFGAIWTLPLVATQYQPAQPTATMQASLQAQQEGRFLDALILLDETLKNGQLDANSSAEMNLLRSSFLLQGEQSAQAIEILAPLLAGTRHAADAYALTAMAQLQQGRVQQALDTANHAHDLGAQNMGGGILPHLALSYALQGAGRLTEARQAIHDFNIQTTTHAPQTAIALAREAELALTLDQVDAARTLLVQAQAVDATHPYVVAVSGLVYLIDGQVDQAKAAFATALQRDHKDAKALLGLGLAEVKMDNLQAGQKILQAANEADPGNALILTYLGRAQQQLGLHDAAIASWHSAQQADRKDPAPWLYQAQAELQANRPLEARASLREAQARTAYRSVYRGEHLLKQDEQLLQANLAELQRRLGLDNLASQTLSTASGEHNSARNQAEVLQGQRFGESARRSLLLQSLFNDRPGSVPAQLDIYGDGAGQTGATVPQHGVVSGLNATHASYNNYDGLFNQHTRLKADATSGSQNSRGEQIRLGLGNDTLGLSLAGLQFKTGGNAPYTNLDNRNVQGIALWQPAQSTQVFVSHQSFHSLHGETRYPADPLNFGEYHQIEDNSSVTRLGLRHSLGDTSELRGLLSRQQTDQTDDWEWVANTLPYSLLPCCGPALPFPQATNYLSSAARGAELQYRRSASGYALQWGASSVRAPLTGTTFGSAVLTNVAQQVYLDWQQALHPGWQLQAGLAWGRNDKEFGASSTTLRRWLPKLGIVYTSDSATHVRLAAWRGLDDAALGNASLAPTTLAGIVLNRPGDTYKLVQGAAFGADKQLNDAWLLEGQAQRRRTDEPVSGTQRMATKQLDESRLALHWQPDAVQVTLAYDAEHIQNDTNAFQTDSITMQQLRSQQLELRWFAGEQWTANLAWSHNLLAATQQSSDSNFNPILLDIQESFDQTDASLNWQFNRTGTLDIGVRNATDRSIPYTEIDPLIPRYSNGRLVYARLKLAW